MQTPPPALLVAAGVLALTRRGRRALVLAGAAGVAFEVWRRRQQAPEWHEVAPPETAP